MTSAALVRVLQFSVARQRNQAQAVRSPAKKAAMIGVLGAKGGVGTTTIACHLSVELGKQSGDKVLLVDLDAAAASATLLMQIKSDYTVLEATKNLHRLDADYWRGIVCASPHGVDVLQAPGVAGFGEPLVAERVRHLLRFTQPLYGSVVVDLGRLGPLSVSLLEDMSQVYVVSSGEIPELYEAGRVLRKLTDMGFGDKLRLILNRASKNSFGSPAGLEKALGYPPFWVFPECSRELFDTYSAGQFMNTGTSLERQMAQMVARALGGETKQPVRNILGLSSLARALGYSPKPQAAAPQTRVPSEIEQSR
jgi:pilus assembly protein CpaE